MKLSIVTASMGEVDLLRCFFDSFRRTTQGKDYQVCVGFDRDALLVPQILPREWDQMVAGLNVDWTVAPRMGAMEATNAAFDLASNEWLVWVADDMVFLSCFDDLRIDGPDPFLNKNRMLAFELLEPYPGSFPPPVDAGTSPETFDLYRAEAAAFYRLLQCEKRAIPKGFFGSAVFHRSKFVPCPTWESDAGAAYSCGDISWFTEIRAAHPDLAFGKMPGNCLYHFGRQTISRHPERAWPGERTWGEFNSRYDMTIQQAWDVLYADSLDLW